MKIRVADEAKRTDPDTGEVFDSAAELRRWRELLLLQRAGKISDLRRQVRFDLVIDGRPVLLRSERYPNGRACRYTADFTYRDIERAAEWPIPLTVEDVKGYPTELARLRIAVVEAIYNVRVLVTA